MTYRQNACIRPGYVITRLAAVWVAVLVVVGLAGVVPAEAGSGDFRLTYTTQDGQRLKIRWDPCTTVTYRVNPTYLSGTAAGRRAGIADARTAMRRVSERTGIRFVYEGTSSQIPRNAGGQRWYERQTGSEIVVAWVRQARAASRSNLLGSGAAGTGGFVYKAWRAAPSWKVAIGRGFVVLDASKSLRAGFGAGVTRGSLLLHELGHVFGLRHVTARSEVMYPTLLPRSSAYYRSGDRAGLQRVGRSAGCIGVPSSVWSPV